MPSPVRIEAQVPTSTYEIHGALKEWARSVLSVSPDIERLQFERAARATGSRAVANVDVGT